MPINPYFIAIWQSSYILEENHESVFKIEIIIINTSFTIQSPVLSHIIVYLELWYVYVMYALYITFIAEMRVQNIWEFLHHSLKNYLLVFSSVAMTLTIPKADQRKRVMFSKATGYWKEAQSNKLGLTKYPANFHTVYQNFIIFSFLLIYHLHNNGQQSVSGYWNILCEHYIKQLYNTIV